MAASPTITTVASLRPGTNGLRLIVKVVATKTIQERKGKGAPQSATECIVGDETGVIVLIARQDQGWGTELLTSDQSATECIVGDETGVIVLIARQDQVELVKDTAVLELTVELVKDGAVLELTGAKVDMVRGSMRLAVESTGRIDSAEGRPVTPMTDNNISLIEYEVGAVFPHVPLPTVRVAGWGAADSTGCVDSAEGRPVTPMTDNSISLIEYELRIYDDVDNESTTVSATRK
eukprot:gene28122-31237_t